MDKDSDDWPERSILDNDRPFDRIDGCFAFSSDYVVILALKLRQIYILWDQLSRRSYLRVAIRVCLRLPIPWSVAMCRQSWRSRRVCCGCQWPEWSSWESSLPCDHYQCWQGEFIHCQSVTVCCAVAVLTRVYCRHCPPVSHVRTHKQRPAQLFISVLGISWVIIRVSATRESSA